MLVYYNPMVSEAMRCRVIRAILGWSARQLARKCDVTPYTVWNWEAGRSVPSITSRKALAEICHEHRIAIRPDGFPVVIESPPS